MRALIWWLYADLKAYRRAPDRRRRHELRARFDRIFRRRTGLARLDRLLARLHANKDERLNMALQPIVENIFKTALRKNPREFTNLLFPLMGPSLRKSIAEGFRSMLENFNKSIEMAFSWKGLRWRFEAWRDQRPRPPSAPTPQVTPDLPFIVANAQAGAAMQPALTATQPSARIRSGSTSSPRIRES